MGTPDDFTPDTVVLEVDLADVGVLHDLRSVRLLLTAPNGPEGSSYSLVITADYLAELYWKIHGKLQ